jgi:hypothetical protein
MQNALTATLKPGIERNQLMEREFLAGKGKGRGTGGTTSSSVYSEFRSTPIIMNVGIHL